MLKFRGIGSGEATRNGMRGSSGRGEPGRPIERVRSMASFLFIALFPLGGEEEDIMGGSKPAACSCGAEETSERASVARDGIAALDASTGGTDLLLRDDFGVFGGSFAFEERARGVFVAVEGSSVAGVSVAEALPRDGLVLAVSFDASGLTAGATV